MIGMKLEKKNIDYKKYSQVADWCNENNASIVDQGDYYEVIKILDISRMEKMSVLDKEYREKIETLELEMAKAKAIEDEDLYTELKEEREALINEYAEKRGEI